VSIIEKPINSLRGYNIKRQVCVSVAEGAKNLAEVETRKETGQREAAETVDLDVKGKMVQFLWKLKKQGVKERTIETYHYYLQLLIRRGADLRDPESVKGVIAEQKWSVNTKAIAVSAYDKWIKIFKGRWDPPQYKRTRRIPFIPLESELDQLISGANRKMAAFLQLLKETGMRSGEALSLKWTDIDFKNNTVTLNEPEKHGNPRVFKISSTLIAMLNMLPKKHERIFGGQNPRNFGRIYGKYRNRMAFKLQNPRLKKISFHTFRHWKATMEYHKTKNILHVMNLLGHKDVRTTLIYTQLIEFEGDEYHSATAKTVEEAKNLVEAGFEYVCTYNDVMLFRKRK